MAEMILGILLDHFAELSIAKEMNFPEGKPDFRVGRFT